MYILSATNKLQDGGTHLPSGRPAWAEDGVGRQRLLAEVSRVLDTPVGAEKGRALFVQGLEGGHAERGAPLALSLGQPQPQQLVPLRGGGRVSPVKSTRRSTLLRRTLKLGGHTL